MRALLVVIVMTSSFPVHADDGAAQRDLLVEYTRIARGSAIGGNCDIVRDLGERVRALDPAYYAASYVTDDAIATCFPKAAPPLAPVAPPTSILTPRRDLVEPPPVMPIVSRELVPPLSGGRLLGEVLLGGLAGTAGVVIGAVIGAVICADDTGEFSCLGSAIIGGLAGGVVGVSAGVYLVGSMGDETGSLGATVLGTVLGGLGAIAVVASLANNGNANDEMLVLTAVSLPIAGAVIGFNLSRGWRSSDPARSGPRQSTGSWGSLVQVDRGRASLGVPMVVHGNVRGTPTTSFSLLSGSF